MYGMGCYNLKSRTGDGFVDGSPSFLSRMMKAKGKDAVVLKHSVALREHM